VLPLVSRFARVHGSEVVLLRVTPLVPVTPSYPEWGPPVPKPRREDVLASLETQRAQLASEGVPVRVDALEGDPAECILDAAEREQADLVAMSTHGRSGVGRWLFGSVAEKVLRTCPAPLLVVREE
jgi:nucleotide-binding universal stress UspA family protein